MSHTKIFSQKSYFGKFINQIFQSQNLGQNVSMQGQLLVLNVDLVAMVLRTLFVDFIGRIEWFGPHEFLSGRFIYIKAPCSHMFVQKVVKDWTIIRKWCPPVYAIKTR